MRLDFSRNLRIMLDKRTVDSSQVRRVLVSGEVKPHIKDNPVDLSV
jgi:hypothetical protein